jgi:hypothetical protein
MGCLVEMLWQIEINYKKSWVFYLWFLHEKKYPNKKIVTFYYYVNAYKIIVDYVIFTTFEVT